MASTECVVCDYTVDLPEPEFESGLTGVQVPSALYLEQIRMVEQEMSEHLASHGIADFVEALHKADAYIAELEEELELAKRVMTTPGVQAMSHDLQQRTIAALEIPEAWQQGLQAPVTVKDEPVRVRPTPDNPHGLAYPNGRPSLRAPGRSGA